MFLRYFGELTTLTATLCLSIQRIEGQKTQPLRMWCLSHTLVIRRRLMRDKGTNVLETHV